MQMMVILKNERSPNRDLLLGGDSPHALEKKLFTASNHCKEFAFLLQGICFPRVAPERAIEPDRKRGKGDDVRPRRLAIRVPCLCHGLLRLSMGVVTAHDITGTIPRHAVQPQDDRLGDAARFSRQLQERLLAAII